MKITPNQHEVLSRMIKAEFDKTVIDETMTKGY